MAKTRTDLLSWSWRIANAHQNPRAIELLPRLQQWTPVKSFPSVIQMELIAQDIIPDPYIGENERLGVWTGDVDWEYRCSFDTPQQSKHIDLVFEGLDTFATAMLNGSEILKSDNMFVPARVAIEDQLRPVGEPNELRILFESAVKVGAALEEKYGKRQSFMRDAKRMHMRKAQYHWGWDWGPIVLTAGPYMPVYLEAYTSRIEDVSVQTKLSGDHSTSQVTVTVSAENVTKAVTADITIYDYAGTQVAARAFTAEQGDASTTLTLEKPKIWWPNGQGDPHLYTVKATLRESSGRTVDEKMTKFGVRTIELIQKPLLDDVPGTTFMFRVNGRDIFSQGGNWIPGDNLLPNITRQRYFDWVRLGKECHLNMIRVWGGGIYETEDFLDACDEMGILVWHDYALACGDYMIRDDFMESLRKEAEYQTRRMRNRACLALLCGANEDCMFAEFDKKYDHFDNEGPFDDSEFPARKIYLDLLPTIAQRLCPDVPYWANSPWGGATSNDETMGDIHQWSVWHGDQRPYQDYKKLSGRFVSEFGMHGFPVTRTVGYFTRGGKPQDLHPQSKLIDCHNKGHGAHTRIARYLAENFRFDMTSLDNFIYASQLMQSEALGYALRDWKRLFNGQGREKCAGALIWQYNDVYPSTSWAFIDYFLRPKPAYYTIKRSFAPISVGSERTPSTRWVDEDKQRESDVPSFKLFAHNTTAGDVDCDVVLRAYDFAAEKYTPFGSDEKRVAVLAKGQNTELGEVDSHPDWTNDSLIILETRIFDRGTGTQLARFVDWPEPYRYLHWPKGTKVSVSVKPTTGKNEWKDQVTVSSDKPIKGLWLQPKYDGSEKDDSIEPKWEDNMLDLMPGEQIKVGVNGLGGRGVKARFLGDWEVGPVDGCEYLRKALDDGFEFIETSEGK